MMWDFKGLVRKQTICHKAHITLHSRKNKLFWLKSACTEPGSKVMKRHQDEMSDLPTCK
jgi:hypothetical protein